MRVKTDCDAPEVKQLRDSCMEISLGSKNVCVRSHIETGSLRRWTLYIKRRRAGKGGKHMDHRQLKGKG